jgi:hypothetical protein
MPDMILPRTQPNSIMEGNLEDCRNVSKAMTAGAINLNSNVSNNQANSVFLNLHEINRNSVRAVVLLEGTK